MKRWLAGFLFLCAVPICAADDPNTTKGFVAGQVYQFGDLAHVNLYNGNLNVSLPLGPTYPAGGNLSYSLTLAYSGNNWIPEDNERHTCPSGPNSCGDFHYESFTTSRRFNAGLGWMVSLGGLLPRGDTADDTASEYFCYRSADGADHPFVHDDGTTDTQPPTTGGPPSYTNDSSYLRVTVACNNACREVEFPDGTIRRFSEPDGQLTQIRDRFNNQVNVSYSTDSSGAPAWTITDSTVTDGTRIHKVSFVKLTAGGTGTGDDDKESFYVVKEVDVAKFGGGYSSYVFHYDPAGDGVDATTLISRLGPNHDTQFIANTLWIPLLRGITLPDGTSYAMTTDRGPVAAGDNTDPDLTGTTGHLTFLTLPTGGKYAWQYQNYVFSIITPSPDVPGGGFINPPAIISQSNGLKSQIVYDRDGTTKLSEQDYDTQLLYQGTGEEAQALQNTVTTLAPSNADDPSSTWVQSAKTVNFFGIGSSMPFTTEPQPDPNTIPDVPNPLTTGGVTRYLSNKTYDANNALLAATYVVYEFETHVKSQQTVTNPTAAGGYLNSSTIDYDTFDGYGHYRHSTTGGNFPGQNVRTTTTAFNQSDPLVTTPGSGIFDTGTFPGTFHEWPAGLPWILNLSTSVTTVEGSNAHKVLTSFDPGTGLLQRTRTLADNLAAPAITGPDLISVFTPDASGNLVQEEYFGGDAYTQDSAALANLTPNGRTFVLSHAYSAGALSKTSYLNPGCTSSCTSILDIVDRTIDTSTGLPSASRDTAQLQTLYHYDVMGRIDSVTPPDALWPTTYTYAVSSSPATVTAATQASASPDMTKALRSVYAYDALGRLTNEDTLGAGQHRYRLTKYDSSGRQRQVSTLDTADPLTLLQLPTTH
jgi:hypothetical protein